MTPPMPPPAVPASLSIVDFRDDLAAAFRDINAEWIEAMFTLEANDRAILDHPRRSIVDRGGIIRFVAAAGLGIVGTCALIRIGEGVFELTKMGVLAAARGRKAGEFLLAHMIAEARAMDLTRLYLLTNAPLRGGGPPLREGRLRPRRAGHGGLRRALCPLRRGDELSARARRDAARCWRRPDGRGIGGA